MPRKEQGWITFQSTAQERRILEEYCQQSQRTKTDILRELVRSLNQQSTPLQAPSGKQQEQEVSETFVELLIQKPKSMKVSARNVLKGTIKRIVKGTVNTEVTLEIAPQVELISTITRTSAEELDLSEGKEAYAVIKSSNIMMAIE